MFDQGPSSEQCPVDAGRSSRAFGIIDGRWTSRSDRELPSRRDFLEGERRDLDSPRNPLLDRAIGITPTRTLTVDALHAFFLGILNIRCRISIWQLISSGSYGDVGNQGENIRIAVIMIRGALLSWYSTYERDHPGETLTRVADLTPSMLGTQNDQKMKTKGAETWGVALFLLSELRLRSRTAGEDGNTLRMAGESLEKIVRIWKRNDWTMPRRDA